MGDQHKELADFYEAVIGTAPNVRQLSLLQRIREFSEAENDDLMWPQVFVSVAALSSIERGSSRLRKLVKWVPTWLLSYLVFLACTGIVLAVVFVTVVVLPGFVSIEAGDNSWYRRGYADGLSAMVEQRPGWQARPRFFSEEERLSWFDSPEGQMAVQLAESGVLARAWVGLQQYGPIMEFVSDEDGEIVERMNKHEMQSWVNLVLDLRQEGLLNRLDEVPEAGCTGESMLRTGSEWTSAPWQLIRSGGNDLWCDVAAGRVLVRVK